QSAIVQCGGDQGDVDAGLLQATQVVGSAHAAAGRQFHLRQLLGNLPEQVLRAKALVPANAGQVQDQNALDATGHSAADNFHRCGAPDFRLAERLAILQIQRKNDPGG